MDDLSSARTDYTMDENQAVKRPSHLLAQETLSSASAAGIAPSFWCACSDAKQPVTLFSVVGVECGSGKYPRLTHERYTSYVEGRGESAENYR